VEWQALCHRTVRQKTKDFLVEFALYLANAAVTSERFERATITNYTASSRADMRNFSTGPELRIDTNLIAIRFMEPKYALLRRLAA
jgi:hypothetical protein